jgi:hypothetical protein
MQQTMAQDSATAYEDLNEPFYDQNMTQQERSRRLLAQQLRLLKSKTQARPSSDISSIFQQIGRLV